MAKKIVLLRKRREQVYKDLGYEISKPEPRDLNKVAASIAKANEVNGVKSQDNLKIDNTETKEKK
jgi:hypothetical protein